MQEARQEMPLERGMIRYALLYAAVHWLLALAVGWLFFALGLGRDLSMVVAVTVAAASVVGWRFAKLHRRPLMQRETWVLIVYCTAYMMLFDVETFWANDVFTRPLSVGQWVFIVAFGVGLDVLSIWFAFRYPVRKLMQRTIEKAIAAAA